MSTPEIVENFDDEDPQNSNSLDDPLFVTELHEFVPLLQDWHAHQVKTVEHFFNVPEGQAVEIEGESEFVLSGDVLRGFKLGLSIAMSYLGNLPFSAAMEEVPNETLQ
jgi:hypothetical protein